MYYQAAKKQTSLYQNALASETKLLRPVSIDYKMINLVAMGILEIGEKSLDLAQLEAVKEVKYLNRFPCAMFKVEGITVLLFKNGKMIITGLKDTIQIPHIKYALEEILEDARFKYNSFEITIQNLVAMVNLGQRIDLEMMCLTMENCMYEPEQFPAAIIKNYRKLGGVFLIFANSKIICLGMHDEDLLDEQFNAVVDELYQLDLVVPKDIN
ncbi:MAG TPA: hypothetical protein VKK79_22095 [Candidatus Lokiarchaeia archaeon]|nr:hypothetical protein [Candidatus Lokiarchaeia archaeon]